MFKSSVPLFPAFSFAFSSLFLMGAAAPSESSYGRASHVIYGDDGRQDPFEQKSHDPMRLRSRATALMVHKSQLPLSADLGGWDLQATSYGEANQLCEGERFFAQPTADAGFCSSFLVAPDIMVTAGHCISSWDCGRIAFVFGFAYEEEGERLNRVGYEDLYECREIIGRERAYGGLDYAVVRLDRPVPNREPLALAPDDNLKEGDGLTVIGYPMALPVKISSGGKVRDTGPEAYFVASLDTFAGNSGSAVLNSDTGEVEGILVRGEGDYTVGAEGADDEPMCFEEHRCPEDGCRGEDVTRVRQFRHVVWGSAPTE